MAGLYPEVAGANAAGPPLAGWVDAQPSLAFPACAIGAVATLHAVEKVVNASGVKTFGLVRFVGFFGVFENASRCSGCGASFFRWECVRNVAGRPIVEPPRPSPFRV
jgi:hypothetical protein